MRRTLLSLTSVLLSLSALVGVGFSAYYFTSGTSVSTAEEFVPHVDNLPDNFSLDESQDYYDLFFFPQPYAANTVTPDGGNNPTYTTRSANSANWYYPTGIAGHNYNGGQETNSVRFQFTDLGVERNYDFTLSFGNFCQGSGGDYDGYWTPGDYSVKHLNVYRHLSTESLMSVGYPQTDMEDAAFDIFDGGDHYFLTFSGWTCNASVAESIGYGRQSGFDLFDTQRNLSDYDRMTPDGTVYSEAEVANHLGEIAIDGSYIGDNRIYFYPIFSSGKDYGNYIAGGTNVEVSGDKIGGNIFKHKYYEHNDARAHTQEVSPMISSVQFTSGNQKKWSDRIATNESADCFLIPTVDIPQNGAQISADAIYYDEGRNEWDSACSLNLDGVEDGLYNIYVFVQSDFDGNYNAQLEYPDEVQTKIDADRITQRFENTFYTSNRGKQNVRVVALLERLYDFKLVGGITETLDYNAQTTYFASRVTDIGSNVTYEIRDVYFPGRENYHRIDLENGHFYNDYVFSIGSSPDWRDLPYTVSCPPDDPLLTTDLTVGVDYDVGTQSRKVVGMKGRGGMYDLTIDINFKTVMSSTTDCNNIESIEISAQPSENDFSILIYMNESGIAEKEGFFDSGSSTGLLGQASFSVQGGSVPSLTGSTLFGGQTFESIVNEHGGYFYDFVTGRRFTIADLSDGSFQVTKPYVFYLNPDGGSK